ncbi:putative bifunctional diguanylate cyclase/phosphodiesterase [Virgisporangium aliadipatigenens]|nr:EAL domain-containing protein [Virgisporangium aliadipatigenens]
MSRRALWILAGWTALLTAFYAGVPAWRGVAFIGIVLGNSVAYFIGLRRNRPRRKLPWLLLWGGTFFFAVGSVVAIALKELGDNSPPSIADVIMIGVNQPMLLLGFLLLARSGAVSRDRAVMLDSLMLAAGALLLAWVFLIGPKFADPALNMGEKAVSAAYPIFDVLTLALMARIAFGAARSTSAAFMLASGTCLAAADAVYSYSQLNGDFQLGGIADFCWILFYLFGGLAVLHPSMTALTQPRVITRHQLDARRVVLGVASLIAPTILFFQSVQGPVRDGVVIAIASAVLVLLAIARMSVVTAGLRRSMGRERELRRACEALLSTTDREQVTTVVHEAIARLLPPGTDHLVVLAVDEGHEAASPEPAAATTVDLRDIGELPAELAATLAGFELVLHCPLSVGTTRRGDLFVAADETALVGLQESVPVLAGQAASMLDQFALNREIGRRNSETYFRTLILNAADIILIVDDNNRITYASPSAQPLFGLENPVGADLIDLVAVAGRHDVEQALDVVRTHLHGPNEVEHWTVAHADGSAIEVEVTVRDLRHEPTVEGLVLTMRDVTERARLEQELLRRAYLDPLTGLGNRLKFHDTVAEVATDAAREGTTAGVLLINIDDFRVVNDSMGHDVGDELLIAVSRRLADALGDRGSVSRLGADEFGVVVHGATDTTEVEHITEEIVSAFTAPFTVSGSVVTAHLSIGVATGADIDDAQSLVSQADVALGTAKSGGKARWRRYEASLHEQVLERMQLRTELDQAIADGDFILHYQPIVDLATGRVRGVEALVRWQHPGRGMVPPLQFIQVAEECGLIVPLGAWVLRQSVADAAGWVREFGADAPYVSVNVSVRQFRSTGFVTQVFDVLEEFGLPAERLTLEITESLLLGDHESINEDIAALRNAGIHVSIDDFGTGYSSLSYLHRVPVDTLKLDKSFVDTISTSQQQLDLVRGIIQLASTLHLDVVAEGIETATDQRLLLEGGCRYGQGFLFARPMPHQQVREHLQALRPVVSAA